VEGRAEELKADAVRLQFPSENDLHRIFVLLTDQGEVRAYKRARDPSRDAHRGYVGPGCRLSGRLNAPGPFNVRGEFVGEIFSEYEVSVGDSGHVDGRILAERVTVEGGGRVGGEVNCAGRGRTCRGAIVDVAVQAASLTLAEWCPPAPRCGTSAPLGSPRFG